MVGLKQHRGFSSVHGWIIKTKLGHNSIFDCGTIAAFFMSTEADKDPTKNQPEEITHPESLSVWGLAWPSILSNLLFASVGLVAIKAVGSLGAEAVAAVGTGQRSIFGFFKPY